MFEETKKLIYRFCRESKCPVQGTIDSHRANGGSESEIKMIKDSYCRRCDIFKIRKWLEANDMRIVEGDSTDKKIGTK